MKYFPPAKMAKLRNDISSFVQMDLETLYDAWERFKDLLRRCPHHGLPLWLQVQNFYNGVNPSTRQLIDSAAGGTLNNKTSEAAYEFIEEMSLNNYQWQASRTKPTKSTGSCSATQVELWRILSTHLTNQEQRTNRRTDGLYRLEELPKVFVGRSSQSRKSKNFQNLPYPKEKKQTHEKESANTEKRLQDIKRTLKDQQVSIEKFTESFGELAKMVGMLTKMICEIQAEIFPKGTEQVKAVRLRSGKELGELKKQSPNENDKARDEGMEDVTPLRNENKPPIPYPTKLKKE
ncbi:Transposon Ty3-I Gag-Pol polyprotein [Gossypium australe]|uniref:Transposon Ty3-I Gag-Pol polyprotein n=1 Tax=Gossypium australe TaxID=47621 RepID=A0A5B6U5P8_9ROSI|nr:Transposon Ty3-I Gag-Pol polyprotein [Gossypium australe]